jgi:hypothetical protein
VDGVICGHIHAAAIKDIGGIRYINCGDWVDSCTAVLEHEDGRMELLEWGVLPRRIETEGAAPDEPRWEPVVAKPLLEPADGTPVLNLQASAADCDRARSGGVPHQ